MGEAIVTEFQRDRVATRNICRLRAVRQDNCNLVGEERYDRHCSQRVGTDVLHGYC